MNSFNGASFVAALKQTSFNPQADTKGLLLSKFKHVKWIKKKKTNEILTIGNVILEFNKCERASIPEREKDRERKNN